MASLRLSQICGPGQPLGLIDDKLVHVLGLLPERALLPEQAGAAGTVLDLLEANKLLLSYPRWRDHLKRRRGPFLLIPELSLDIDKDCDAMRVYWKAQGIVKALHRVVHQLVLLLVFAEAPDEEPDPRPELARLLRRYLRLRDRSIPAPELIFEEEGFVYRGHARRLAPKPLEVLRAISNAPERTLSRAELKKLVWRDEDASDGTIRSTIATLRAALRRAFEALGIEDASDPLEQVDCGIHGRGWKLVLPPPV